jgi:predicted transcriptional regulator
MPTQIILEIDDATARELERVAPSRDRKRSEFLRRALRQALDAEAERRMREAYTRVPDDAGAPYLDAAAWEPPARPKRPRR